MRRIVLSLSALGLAAAASFGAALAAVAWVEDRSQDAVAAALAGGGQEWVEARADGLRVVLTGTAPDEAARFRALSVAGDAVDAGRLVDAMEVAPPEPVAAPDYRVEVLRTGDGVSLIGLVPKTADREALRDAVRRVAGTAMVTDLLETAEGPPGENWQEALEFGVEALSALPSAKVSITAERVSVAALTEDQSEKRQVEAALSRGVPEGVALALDISAPRPVMAPFTTRFLIGPDGGGHFDVCAAPSEADRAEMLRAAVAAGLDGKESCPLALGAPTSRWGEAVAHAIAALDGIGGGSVTFSDADVTLVARQGVDPARFDAEVGALQADLPPVFALHAVLPAPPSAPEEGGDSGPAQIVATRSADGEVDVEGRLGDARARSVVEGFAQATFGAAATSLGVRLDEAVPSGWTNRVLAGLDALGHVEEGTVRVLPDHVALEGRTGSIETRAQIARLLSAQLGEGADFAIDVAYSSDLDPAANQPTPGDCVRKIEGAAAENKITFAPSSSDVEAESESTLDRIAEILRECGPIPMEIAGYTDSQGREEMNLALSEERAQAVLEGLMARRVLTTGIVAKGYGEADPVADNDTEAGREANRRIEFHLLADESRAEAFVGPK